MQFTKHVNACTPHMHVCERDRGCVCGLANDEPNQNQNQKPSKQPTNQTTKQAGICYKNQEISQGFQHYIEMLKKKRLNHDIKELSTFFILCPFFCLFHDLCAGLCRHQNSRFMYHSELYLETTWQSVNYSSKFPESLGLKTHKHMPEVRVPS